MASNNKMFMDPNSIKECVMSLKIKKTLKGMTGYHKGYSLTELITSCLVKNFIKTNRLPLFTKHRVAGRPPDIPLMYNLVLWNNFQTKKNCLWLPGRLAANILNQRGHYYLPVCCLLRIQQYPVNATYNNDHHVKRVHNNI